MIEKDDPKRKEMCEKVIENIKEAKAEQEKLIGNFTNLIDGLITTKITEYNKANNVIFQDINSFSKYMHDISLPQYAISKTFLDWNSALWDTARLIQSDVMAGNREVPTEEELMAELPLLGL